MALRNTQILVVEDDDRLRAFLGRILTDAGATVVTVSNGFDAVDALRHDARWTAVVLDLVLPHMNGLEILELLRADATLRGLPVLVTTGTMTWPWQFERYQPVSTLAKPFTAEQFVAALQHLMLTCAA